MSNSRVRKALEARETHAKTYEAYKKKESLLTNYQMCKAYFHDLSASISKVVELILREKYNLPWQLKFIRQSTFAARGKSNALITIPKFKYEERVNDILSKFVRKTFDSMVNDYKYNHNKTYPLMLQDILENT